MAKKKEEIELTMQEKRELIKILQKNCKHEKGYITNLPGDSVCFQCGKSWMKCESESRESKNND
ncbi:MAG: hypothetical protein BWY47_01532 [Bacteroidetes bacterium ADurb.Bin302]|jgi:hypothetical protein|nr:MAG: hypothetical protein BWY47_01532 [Bacteroidetes bacterium ADurb.Bin302]